MNRGGLIFRGKAVRTDTPSEFSRVGIKISGRIEILRRIRIFVVAV